MRVLSVSLFVGLFILLGAAGTRAEPPKPSKDATDTEAAAKEENPAAPDETSPVAEAVPTEAEAATDNDAAVTGDETEAKPTATEAETAADQGETAPDLKDRPAVVDEQVAPEQPETKEESVSAVAPPEVEETRSAAPGVAASGGVVLDRVFLTGSYLVSYTHLSPMRVDLSGDGAALRGEVYGQDMLVRHRLRFEPQATFGEDLKVVSDLQLATGFLAVDNPADHLQRYGVPRGDATAAFGERQTWIDQVHLRKLFVDWKTPVGAVIVGRMASQWGLGLLANGGDDDNRDWGGTVWGTDRNYGDVVDRILVATAPLAFGIEGDWAKRLTLAAGADFVERDERISRSEGDSAWEAIGALRYAYQKREAGVYVAYRDLEDRNDNTLNVLAVDFFGKGQWKLGDLELNGAGEVVWVTGDTTWGRNNAYTGKIDVAQLGYVARGGVSHKPTHLGLDIELGYASGDSNPNDGYLRNFSFDPQYNPSLVLFEELRAAESVASAANASDPARVGYPSDAVRFVPTNGSVTNAIYLRPTIRYEAADVVPEKYGKLGARLAMLWAMAEEPIVDPFASTLAGGTTVNYQGGDGNQKGLGVELDLGVDYSWEIQEMVEVSVSAQYGRLWPGKAFENAVGKKHPPVDVAYGRLGVTWLPPPPPPKEAAEEATTEQ